jgi:hypothetical protein
MFQLKLAAQSGPKCHSGLLGLRRCQQWVIDMIIEQAKFHLKVECLALVIILKRFLMLIGLWLLRFLHHNIKDFR